MSLPHCSKVSWPKREHYLCESRFRGAHECGGSATEVDLEQIGIGEADLSDSQNLSNFRGRSPDSFGCNETTPAIPELAKGVLSEVLETVRQPALISK